MSSDTQEAFGRVNKNNHANDPALSVDALDDFLPAPATNDVDPGLAVGALSDFFTNRDIDEIEDYYFSLDDGSITATPGEQPEKQPVETPVRDDSFDTGQLFESEQVFQSDIQRAAMEFQRFAEQFHAFAAECQNRVTF